MIDNILKQSNINKNETIVIAVSGGVDSMVLFHIARNYFDNIVVAHVNHNKRKESELEEIELRKLAKSFNIPFECFKITCEIKKNFQSGARDIRYKFFKEVLIKYKSKFLLTAHHLDDNIETILFKLLRGASIKGYSGIAKYSCFEGEFNLIRPLIEVKKNEIIKYAIENSVHYFEDASNSENYYSRNYIRNVLINEFREEIPNFEKKLLYFADLMRIYDSQNKVIIEKIHQNRSVKEYLSYNENVRISYLTDYLIMFKITPKKNLLKDIDSFLGLNTTNGTLDLEKDWIFLKSYDKFSIEKKDIIGEPDYGFTVNLDTSKKITLGDNTTFFTSQKFIKGDFDDYICYNKKDFDLSVRYRKAGDKLHFEHFTKSLKKYLVDIKYPKHLRNRLYIVVDNLTSTIVWIPGMYKNHKIFSYQESDTYVFYLEGGSSNA